METLEIFKKATEYCEFIKRSTGRESYAPNAFVAGYLLCQDKCISIMIKEYVDGRIKLIPMENLLSAKSEFDKIAESIDPTSYPKCNKSKYSIRCYDESGNLIYSLEILQAKIAD